jgi:hypothetical protein
VSHMRTWTKVQRRRVIQPRRHRAPGSQVLGASGGRPVAASHRVQ